LLQLAPDQALADDPGDTAQRRFLERCGQPPRLWAQLPPLAELWRRAVDRLLVAGVRGRAGGLHLDERDPGALGVGDRHVDQAAERRGYLLRPLRLVGDRLRNRLRRLVDDPVE